MYIVGSCIKFNVLVSLQNKMSFVCYTWENIYFPWLIFVLFLFLNQYTFSAELQYNNSPTFQYLFIMNPSGSGSSSSTRKSSGNDNAKRKGPATRNKPSGNKGNTSSSGTNELEITEETMAFYKAMEAKLKANKKAAAASQDEGKLL